jgi:hypothetical protein
MPFGLQPTHLIIICLVFLFPVAAIVVGVVIALTLTRRK